jgi:hypothetical protein
MSVLDPVSPFLALIDRIISLVKARDTKRREYFEKIIDPLYTQFKPLGENYLNLFREAQEAVRRSKKGRKTEAISLVRRRRDEFAAARAHLKALLEVCEKHSKKGRDEELVDFVQAMSRFFRPMGTHGGLGSLGTQLVDFFEVWESRSREGRRVSVGEDPLAFIQGATARLETSWYEIAGRYMELKFKYLE